MEIQDKVLETMKSAGEPLNAGKIAELSGLERKDVDKAMVNLKKEGIPFRHDNITIKISEYNKLLVTWWTPTLRLENITIENSIVELDQSKKEFTEISNRYEVIADLQNNLDVEFHVFFDSGKAGIEICSEIDNELTWHI